MQRRLTMLILLLLLDAGTEPVEQEVKTGMQPAVQAVA